MDDQTRRMLLVAAGIVCLLLGFEAAAWFLNGTANSPVPVVEAVGSPIRVRPSSPGGLEIGGLHDGVLDAGPDGQGGAPDVMAPFPEEPSPAALRAQASGGAAASLRGQAEVEAGAAPASQLDSPERMALSSRSSMPAARHHVVQVLAPSPTGKAPVASERTTQVQLAALASEAAAVAEWKAIQGRVPELRGRTPIIERAHLGNLTQWRLRLNGFDGSMEAKEFCHYLLDLRLACRLANF